MLKEREPKGKIKKDQPLGQVAICHPTYREIFSEKKNGHIIVQEPLIKNDVTNKTPPAITSSDRQLLSNINTNTFPPMEHLLIATGLTEVRKVFIKSSKDLAKKRISGIQEEIFKKSIF